MAIRYNANPVSAFGVPPLPTGFDNISIPNDLTLPPVGIEDVDVALFRLFNAEIKPSITTDEGVKQVPILFASGEKWAMLKKGRALRDRQGTLLLPLITIGRNNIQQVASEDQAGRGINQQSGDLVIKRRLNEGDRSYQTLINRYLVKNQSNLAVNAIDATEDTQLITRRSVGDLDDTSPVFDGGLLATNNVRNVWEVVIIPAPQFFTANYEVTVWTSYTSQMNQIIEGLIASFLPQGNAWKLETEKGYWFIATVDGNLYSPENNFDDMSQEERVIKYKFSIKVPGYILASRVPGAPVPIRRYVSNPDVTFSVGLESDSECVPLGNNVVDDPFLGSDDPTLPKDDKGNIRRDQRNTGRTRLHPPGTRLSVHDPALKSLNRGTKPAHFKQYLGVNNHGRLVTRYMRIKKVNPFTGETIYGCLDIDGALSTIQNPFEDGFFVVDQDGNAVVDELGNPIVFVP